MTGENNNLEREGDSMLDRDEDNFRVLMDALDEWVEEGPGGIRPVFCANPGCEGELMDFDMVGGTYKCPICGFELYMDDVDKYLQDILDGKYEEEE